MAPLSNRGTGAVPPSRGTSSGTASLTGYHITLVENPWPNVIPLMRLSLATMESKSYAAILEPDCQDPKTLGAGSCTVRLCLHVNDSVFLLIPSIFAWGLSDSMFHRAEQTFA